MNIYVVVRQTGSYDDFSADNLKAFFNEDRAEDFIKECEQKDKLVIALREEIKKYSLDSKTTCESRRTFIENLCRKNNLSIGEYYIHYHQDELEYVIEKIEVGE